MPNWVFNHLTIEGSPELVKELKEQMNKPFVDYITPIGDLSYHNKQEVIYSNPVFSFRNIIGPTDLEAYKEQPWTGTADSRIENPDSWYIFNNREWGTKWDVAVADGVEYPETELVDEEPNGENYVLHYKFDTAWSPPFPAMEKLSAQFPSVLLTLSYQEETGWGGEAEFANGEMLSDADYNWKCNECDYAELGEPPYCDDCEYDVCPSCGYQEADEPCQTHAVQSETEGE